ncbi:MAG: SurA N-terminal domain-containing protein [Alphaproteobacteria bacterium]|nr:SurA N-terminal domain-containing protein [Alphaproteobacteria bacterium]
MLQTMRHFAHSWVVKGLMMFLILSFGIWGIGDIFRGNPLQQTVAKAGNETITVGMLNHAFEQTVARARQTISPDLTLAQARQFGLLDKTLDGEIDRALIDQDIKKLNIDVPPQAVLQMIANVPQFRAKDGTFNRELFAMYLQQQGLSETGFVAKGQHDMARQVLLNVLSSSRSVPQIEIDTLYKARAQKRILDVATIDANAMTGIAAPDDKALHDFYDKNPQLFTAPEYRALTIAALSTDAIAKDITISDADVKKAYDDKGDTLAHPEQRDIVQVVLQDEDKAKALAAQARAAGDLAKAAKKDGDAAVPLDALEAKNLMPALATPVFAMKSGAVSDPIHTQLGWHVVEVTKIIPAGKPSFDAVKDSLRAELLHDRAVDQATQIVNKMDDDIAAGEAVEDIANDLKLRLVKIPAVDAQGQTPDGKTPSEFPDKDAMLKDAFAQNAGDTSNIEDDKQGNYYVVRTDQITPAAVKPFDSVKADVAKDWMEHAREAKAHDVAIAVEKDLKAGKPLDSVVQAGVTVRQSTPVSAIGDTDALLPPDLVQQALRLGKGETAVAAQGGKDYVARVASIVDADMSKPDPRKGMIAPEIKQQMGEEILDEYLDYLHRQFPVRVNTELMAQLRQQGE